MAKKKKEEEKKQEDPNLALNKKLDQMQEEGMAKTNAWADMWNEGIRNFYGDQLRGKKKHKNWDWVVINYLWPSAMQEIAKLSKHNPKILAHPWEDADIDAAQAWQSKLQWDWQNGLTGHGMRLAQIAELLDAKIFGYSVSKIYWEDKIEWDDEQKEWAIQQATRG